MNEVKCPVCGGAIEVGIPQDATITTVEEGDMSDVSTTEDTKTRVVRCPEEHGVAVTFTVTTPDQSNAQM